MQPNGANAERDCPGFVSPASKETRHDPDVTDAAHVPPPGEVDAIAVFRAVMDLSPQERLVRLEQLCGTDGALRGEVEELLRHHDLPGTALRGFATRERAPETTIAPPVAVAPAAARRPIARRVALGLGGLALGALAFTFTQRAREQREFEQCLRDASALVATDPLACRAQLAAAPRALREVRWAALQAAIDPVVATHVCPAGVAVNEGDVAFTASGAPRFAYARGDVVCVVDVLEGVAHGVAADRAVVARLHAGMAVRLPSLAADAATVAAWTQLDTGAPAIVVWDCATGVVLRTARIPAAEPVRLTLDAAAARVAWCERAVVRVLDVCSGELRSFGSGAVAAVPHFAADGAGLWVGAYCHALVDGRLRSAAPAAAEWAVPSRNGAWLVCGDAQRAWLQRPDAAPQPSAALVAAPHAAASSVDARVLALAVADAVTVGDLDSGQTRMLAHAAHRVALDRDGRRLLVVDATGAALLRLAQRDSAR